MKNEHIHPIFKDILNTFAYNIKKNNKMKKHEKLKRIRLLNFVMFGESKKENFNKNEVEKLRQTSLNEVRKELKEISDNYFDENFVKIIVRNFF